MTAARARAPTLVWLLTALTCLLIGIAIGEGGSQAVGLPAAPPGAAVTVAAAIASTPTAEPTPTQTPTPVPPTPWPSS